MSRYKSSQSRVLERAAETRHLDLNISPSEAIRTLEFPECEEKMLRVGPSNPFSILERIRSTGSRARWTSCVSSFCNSDHSFRTRSKPNSTAISSKSLNRGRSSAARICVESSAFGLDQTKPRCFCQNSFAVAFTRPFSQIADQKSKIKNPPIHLDNASDCLTNSSPLHSPSLFTVFPAFCAAFRSFCRFTKSACVVK